MPVGRIQGTDESNGAYRRMWIDLLAAFCVVGILVLGPGYLTAWALGLRGLWRWGAAAPAGVTIVSTAAVVMPILGVTWSVVPVLIVGAVFAACAFALRLSFWRRAPRASDSSVGVAKTLPAVVLLVAGIVMGAQLLLTIGSPSNISQTFDNVFHLNAVRYVLDTGNASPLFVGTMTSAAGVPFYPSLWHALGALVVQVVGVSIPVASNAVMGLFVVIVWPASALLLVRALWGRSPAATISGAAAIVAMAAFPLLMIDYGVLFPYMAGLSLVPAAVAAVVAATSSDCPPRERFGLLVLFVGALPGLVVSHPGAFIALVVLTTAALVVQMPRVWRSLSTPLHRVWMVGAIAAYLVVVGIAWYLLRPPELARSWLPVETAGQAIGEVLTLSVNSAPVNVVMAVVVAVGIVAAIRVRTRNHWIALAMFAAAAALYVVAAGLPYPVLRDVVTGAWYNNTPRLAAIMPLVWVPLAALGGETLWRLIQRHWTHGIRRRVVGFAVVSLLVLVVVPQVTSMRQAISSAHRAFALDGDSPLLTADEMALLQRLPDEVAEGDTVAGSPWTGAALAYAIADRKVLMRHTLTDTSEETDLINDDLDVADEEPAVCDAILETGTRYVLDFGDQEVNWGRHEFPGFADLESSGAVELADKEGDARLYRIVACAP
ncbi:DUF6541 family protein [Microbacterium sp. Gd 4-13]|uniref:DUF6541 family protein n=1 Tax=Microbacterium sp. Gd 4-13 TaxID=2173179 RepID=UPI00268BA2AB